MTQLMPKHRNVFILDKSLVKLDDEILKNAKKNFFDENLKVIFSFLIFLFYF